MPVVLAVFLVSAYVVGLVFLSARWGFHTLWTLGVVCATIIVVSSIYGWALR